MKRSPDKKHTLTYGSLTDIFRQSRLYCVFTYTYSLLNERDICDCWNILVKLPCVYVCLSSGDLFILSVRVSSFFSYFWLIRISLLQYITYLNILGSSLKVLSHHLQSKTHCCSCLSFAEANLFLSTGFKMKCLVK